MTKVMMSSNEHPNHFAHLRDMLPDIKVSDKPLPAGDYMFSAHDRIVSVEVKWSIGDLLDSLQTVGEAGGPRLAVEVRKMVEVSDIPILLIPQIRQQADGKVLRNGGVSGWQYNSVKGVLSDVALYGLIVDEWDGDLAQRLAQWVLTLTQPGHEWIRQRGRPEFISLDPLYTEAVWMLCAAPGIGPVTAEALLKQFLSVFGVAIAPVSELLKVKGVGTRTAASLHKVLHQEWK